MSENTLEENCWISAYIYFDGNIYSPECDSIIKYILIPFLEDENERGLYERYFFIRYSGSGSHLRVRFYGNRLVLEKKLKPLFEKIINKNLSEYMTKNKNDDYEKKTDQNKYYLKWVEYQPEIERYGGEETVKVAEEFFYYSSIVAIKIIENIDVSDKSSRLGKGMAFMVILLQKFCPNIETAIKLISQYYIGYLKVIAREEKYREAWIEYFDTVFDTQSTKLIELVSKIWKILEENEELPDPFQKYSKYMDIINRQLKSVYKSNKIMLSGKTENNWLYCVFFIIPNYIHMMNNRLGIKIQEESYLAFIINKALNYNITHLVSI